MTRVRAFWAAALLVFLAPSALASIPRFDDILPLSKVHPGQVGYGLTVFRGTKIERFEVTVVGVVKKGSLIVPGHDMILVRMKGGPMTARGANLIKGMSGSPVYVNGKIIGAFSQGEPTTKEPLGGVTPIEDMLEAWDPKLPDTPVAALPAKGVQTAALSEPIQVGGRRIDKVVYNVPMSSGLRSHGSTLVMHPCSTFVTVPASLTKSARDKLAKALAPYNLELTQSTAGGGANSGFKGAPLVPGAAFSMLLATGDFSMPGTGTVSYRRANRILGFGHYFMNIGPIDAPLSSAYIYDVYPLLAGSYKISSPGPVVGSSTQDRNFAISGVIGMKPKMVPVTVDVRDLTTGRSRVFHSQVVSHPNLYSALTSAAVSAAITEVRSIPGAAMAHITTTVDADEVGKVTRNNVVFASHDIDAAATADLDDLLGIFTSNPFYPVGIKAAYVRVEIEGGHRTAQVERIFLKQSKFEPGETAEVGIVVKPYKQPAVTRTVKIAIPANTPTGRYVLQVRGGAVPPPISFGGFILRAQSPQNPDQAPPVSIRQMVNRYDDREKNNDLVARLILPTTAVNVEGERLSNLPPSLDALMRSAKSSGVRMERDEVRVVQPTDWVISGQQLLAINVQRHDNAETPSPSSPPSGQPAGITPPSGSSGSAFSTQQDEDNSSAGPSDGDAANAFSIIDDPKKAPEKKPARDDKKRSKTSPKSQDKAPAGADQPDQTKADAQKTTQTPAQPQPANAAPADANEKPVARMPQVWRQTSRTDFVKGTSHGVSVTTQGDLRLTRSLEKLHTSSESFLWSLTPDGNGGLFAGTGTEGRVLHLDAAGNIKILARLPEISVHSLLLAPDGTLWAATGPNGRIYKIAPDGQFTVAYKAAEKYALALARDSKGNVYIGTGGGAGNIYRIAPDGTTSLFFKTSQEHVLSLAVDRSDNLYAGTSNNGLVYRIAPDGKAGVLYDAPEASITALAMTSRGDLYAVTAPRGVIYRISPDGLAKTVYDKAPAAFTAIAVAPDDTVYAAGGSAVYAVRPDDTVLPLGNHNDIDILALAADKDGKLYAGTGNVAEVYASVPLSAAPNGTYESVVHDAKQLSRWGAVRWTASVPAGTRMTVETRTGNSAEPDSTWSAWSAPLVEPDGGRISSPAARYIQYRITLASDSPGASPVLRDIAVSYLPKNQPPKVTFQAPAGGERWARQQTIKWESSDPDKDTLNYELYYSPDNGAHWLPVPGAGATTTTTTPAQGSSAQQTAQQTATQQAPANATAAPARNRPPTVEEVTAELDKHPDLPPSLREAILARARLVNASLMPAPAGTPAPITAPAGRETTRSLDTKTLPDGRYMLKVVATDRPSNAVDPLTSESISEPFVICNTPPLLYVLQASTVVQPDHSVTLEGTATQQMIAITAVQYRVDGGEWLAALPVDGIFDTPTEGFSIRTAALAPGTHTIEVKAFNAANVSAADKVTVEIK